MHRQRIPRKLKAILEESIQLRVNLGINHPSIIYHDATAGLTRDTCFARKRGEMYRSTEEWLIQSFVPNILQLSSWCLSDP